jgi:pimeloyl-ACP methyl ester carboxylesterase
MLAAAFLLAEIVVNLFAATLVLPIFERRPPFNVRPAEPDLSAEPIRFPTSGGLELAGSIYRPDGEPRGLIVFCPEFGGSHWSAPTYVEALIEDGFAVLAFDFRNQGESDDQAGYVPTHWLTEREVADVRSALRYAESLAEFAGLPVGLFGVSRGANAALAAAARSPSVRAVAVEGAFSTDAMMVFYTYRWAELYVPRWVIRLAPEWHLAATMRFARRISQLRRGVRYCVLERWLPQLAGRPVLLVTGEKDSYVAPVIAERLRRQIGPSCRPLWVVPDAKHNQARLADPDGYDRQLRAFFGEIAVPRRRPGPMPAASFRELVSAGR